ncbi:MAG: HAMP domain-containing sensor histidine kinase [Kofleriaceae bacterium]
MLSQFVVTNRLEIIARCRARVASRVSLRATELELEHGIPLFLDQLAAALRLKLGGDEHLSASASMHGGEMFHRGFTVAQVVNDYADACQTISELAIERGARFSTEDFKELNLCLDEAIAGAVTEYARQREIDVVAEGVGRAKALSERAAEDLGFLAHELRNLVGTATLAFAALKEGSVGIAGSTGRVLERSLLGLTHLVDRSLAAVRLEAGVVANEEIVIGELIEEIEFAAMIEAKARGHQVTVETVERTAVVLADRQILASIIVNLMQNAFKYSRPASQIRLRTTATTARVRIEVEDRCGGLPPGKVETLFQPFEQRSADRSGLGLGLAICRRGVEAIGGKIEVHDHPGVGCTFVVDLPRAR